MKIRTFIAFAVSLTLFVSAHPTPEPLNKDDVSKVGITNDELKSIIKNIPENTKIDIDNEEKDILMRRALKKASKDVRKKVGKDVRKKVGKDVRKKGPHRVSKNKNLASF
ncbi:hypothetical protein H8356DRAFT_1745142 [Neocallimastix lanati (nom. inval.)]|nr:hypothetical protein H8356DRAFT_1745142 [Neocallimastix sp. JGI-2020a]